MVTLRDVAAQARVSVATVSRIVNDRPSNIRVGEETRQRVLRIVRTLNYQPNLMARSLKREKSHTLGVIVVDFEDDYIGQILSAIEHVAAGRGYYPLFSSVENNKLNHLDSMEIFMQNQVGGILFVGSTLDLPVGIGEQLESRRLRAVSIAKRVGKNVPYLGVDNEKGAFLATEHLLTLGHRTIGFLLGPAQTEEAQDRYRGYQAALRQYGLGRGEIRIETTVGTSSSSEDGYRATRELLQTDSVPTALFAWDDRIAFGAIRAISEKGLQVPRDVSVVGFDDTTMAAFFNPPLTTVRQPMTQMGQKATGVLIDLLEDKIAPDAVADIILEPTLIVRQSTQNVRDPHS